MRKKKGPCSYNIGVQCDGSDCSRCGWCPSVEERRLSNLRGPDALTAEKAEKADKVCKTVDVYDETTERKVGTLSWPAFIHKEEYSLKYAKDFAEKITLEEDLRP